MADHRVIFRHFPCDRARCELRPGPTDVLTRTPHQEPFSASKCGKSVIERPRSEPDSGLFSSMGPRPNGSAARHGPHDVERFMAGDNGSRKWRVG